jgi:hypothetical protein
MFSVVALVLSDTWKIRVMEKDAMTYVIVLTNRNVQKTIVRRKRANRLYTDLIADDFLSSSIACLQFFVWQKVARFASIGRVAEGKMKTLLLTVEQQTERFYKWLHNWKFALICARLYLTPYRYASRPPAGEDKECGPPTGRTKSVDHLRDGMHSLSVGDGV